MPPAGSRDSTRFVSLFQKAHSYIASLQRVDEQIATLFEQRRKAIEDMRAIQAMINTEFQRVLELDRILPADSLSQDDSDGGEAAKPERPVVEVKAASREARVSTPAPVRMPVLETT